MKLTTVKIENFRLLESVEVSFEVDRGVTVLVGPNNSGKTSLAEALDLFVSRAARDLSVYDFSLRALSQLESFGAWVSSNAAQGDAVDLGAGVAPGDETAEPPVLPRISLTLTFSFTRTAGDLAVASELLMSLDETASTVVLEFDYSVRDPENLAASFLGRADAEDESFVNFLRDSLSKHFALSLYKVSPSGTERERLTSTNLLQRLLRIDFLPAQRHMEDEERGAQATKLSRLLNSHYEDSVKNEQPEEYEDLALEVKRQAAGLTGRYGNTFGGLKSSLADFGYPSTPDIHIKAELTASTLFKDSTRVYYEAVGGDAEADEGEHCFELPERYNGLGFKNLVFMVLQLRAFRDRLVGDASQPIPRVHLVVIEEPEVHLHPQMQAVFVDKVGDLLDSSSPDGAQLLLTTHSSHVLARVGFAPVRYFRSAQGVAMTRDLLRYQASEVDADRSDAVEFLARYLTLTRCDLLFCDKAILIEGQVERLLLPEMILRSRAAGDFDLTSDYLSIVEVGGAYAHIFREFVHFLGVPTLVVTDIDSVGQDGKKCPVATGVRTSNAALKNWLPRLPEIRDLLQAGSDAKTDGLVRVAYQVPEEANGPCARTFEEAFIYANAEWLIQNRNSLPATGSRFDDYSTVEEVVDAAYGLLPPKVDFALDLLFAQGWRTPRYISVGLSWLAEQER